MFSKAVIYLLRTNWASLTYRSRQRTSVVGKGLITLIWIKIGDLYPLVLNITEVEAVHVSTRAPPFVTVLWRLQPIMYRIKKGTRTIFKSIEARVMNIEDNCCYLKFFVSCIYCFPKWTRGTSRYQPVLSVDVNLPALKCIFILFYRALSRGVAKLRHNLSIFFNKISFKIG